MVSRQAGSGIHLQRLLGEGGGRGVNLLENTLFALLEPEIGLFQARGPKRWFAC